MSGKLELSKALLRAAHDRDGLTEDETLRIRSEHGLSVPQSAALHEMIGDHDDDLANSDPRMIALEEISGTLELLEEPAE